ncbi:hypothetical protein [Neopusillimonas aromaticivorans]|nr:hypothetical protein [Neopusillimonas aromaticivorans]WJJ93518.1 hypothetical protein N7E01_16610 [Neopusillimonas aromaticivorans]
MCLGGQSLGRASALAAHPKAVLLKTDDPVERLDMLREVLIVKGVLP